MTSRQRHFQPGVGSRGLLRDCKTSRILRECTFDALDGGPSYCHRWTLDTDLDPVDWWRPGQYTWRTGPRNVAIGWISTTYLYPRLVLSLRLFGEIQMCQLQNHHLGSIIIIYCTLSLFLSIYIELLRASLDNLPLTRGCGGLVGLLIGYRICRDCKVI